MHNGQALKAPHEALAHLKNFLILLSTPTTSFFFFHLLLALLTHHEIPPIYSSTTHPNTFSLTISCLLVPFPVILHVEHNTLLLTTGNFRWCCHKLWFNNRYPPVFHLFSFSHDHCGQAFYFCFRVGWCPLWVMKSFMTRATQLLSEHTTELWSELVNLIGIFVRYCSFVQIFVWFWKQ